MKLNLACGSTRWPGFENSDIHGGEGTTYLDLEHFPYPYPDDSAEIVMLSHALFMGRNGQPAHPHPEYILGECHRILRPGGWLRIDDNPWRCYRKGAIRSEEEARAGYPDEWRYPREELIATLREIGFSEVMEIDPSMTLVPCDAETRSALIGNHSWHDSFTIEARK